MERGDTAEPVARFEGAREGVKEFVWRTRGGKDLDYGMRLLLRKIAYDSDIRTSR